MKKRFVSVLLSTLMLFGVMGAFTGCTPRSEKLLIHNWEDYMDEEYINDKTTGFAAYYKELTGKNVKVEFSTFSTNEDMYEQIKSEEMDYDLVCPSDYMNERMQNEDLLLPIDYKIVYGDGEKQTVDPKNIYEPAMLDIVSELDTDAGKWLDYAVPYMWGTLGIMYDATKISADKVNTWDCLLNTKYITDNNLSKKFFMKDSERDAFAAANIYLTSKDGTLGLPNSDGYMDRLKAVMNAKNNGSDDASISDTINSAINLLKTQKEYVFNYEVDKGKAELVAGKTARSYGLFWSCDAGYAMLENQDLYYTVPEEGSNVWFDAFVIPKYSKNPTAAQYFLRYLLEESTSLATVEFVGAATPIVKTTEAFKDVLETDDEWIEFFESADKPEEFKEMYFEMMFPSDELLSRCAMMRDFGAFGSVLNQKWNNDVRTA